MSTLSDAYRNHPLHPNHIVPLDFSAVRTMPDSHVWQPESCVDDISFEELLSSPVPVIDLADANAPELIGQACETWGVFQLVNHGISLSHIEEVEHEAGRLFALPTEQKLKALRTPCGATGYGVARITPFFSKYMWHEGFTIIGSPADHVRELWPHDHGRFCDVMENYQKKMKGLAERLTRLIFDSLKISEEEISWLASTNGSGGSSPPSTASTALQLNSYPSCPDPNQAMGLAPHTDTSLLTILHQSETNGLQVFRPGLGWVLVPPVAGAFVVNIGDILHILSNARFPNTLHRVVVNGSRQRFSVAYFYSPPTDYVVSPLYKGLNSGEDNIIPRYRSVAVKEYIGLKAKNLENALSIIRT
ncbi:hypothetical protein FH972_026848 [Carpinus fangiana]|uniref:gibberellin 3beta-dioxygenase n=1 Tax=Carpinus fangiana TaxID=176857 RepID=A0A5N6L587_9ROSI|nr:hypothetical protein FH972_026848 [Carpinus fangiana]